MIHRMNAFLRRKRFSKRRDNWNLEANSTCEYERFFRVEYSFRRSLFSVNASTSSFSKIVKTSMTSMHRQIVLTKKHRSMTKNQRCLKCFQLWTKMKLTKTNSHDQFRRLFSRKFFQMCLLLRLFSLHWNHV